MSVTSSGQMGSDYRLWATHYRRGASHYRKIKNVQELASDAETLRLPDLIEVGEVWQKIKPVAEASSDAPWTN